MTIAKCKLDESTKLAFGVSITGASGQPETRFIIDSKDYSISFPCKATNEGVEVNLSGLKNILKAGDYPVRLEVVLENKIYTPLTDTITFEPSVEVTTKNQHVETIKESVKITVLKPIITENVLRKTQAATIIAQSLKYKPTENEEPQSIIEHAVEQSKPMSDEQRETLANMLKLAEEVGISTKSINLHALNEGTK